MRDTIKKHDGKGRQWLWFVGLYAASLAIFTAVVYLLRWLIL